MKRVLIFTLCLLLLSGCTKSNSLQQSTTIAPTSTEGAPPETTLPPEPAFDPHALAQSMTDEELAGQIFLARCPGENAVQDIETYNLGGFILFGVDFRSKSFDDVAAAIASYQAASTIPMLIAVDEEGGIVNRVSCYPQFRESKFPSPRALFDEGGLALILETEQEKRALLRSFGINVNLAPVCDITTDPEAFMYSRSLGQSPDITGQYIASVVADYSTDQMGCVLNTFPVTATAPIPTTVLP